MTDDLDPLSLEINRIISQLDDVAHSYEARWGNGNMVNLVREVDIDLAQKWERHCEKLNTAILTKDAVLVRQLVEGAIKGYARMESALVGAKKCPSVDFVYKQICDGREVVVVRTISDTKMFPVDKKQYVISCEEMVNFFLRETETIFKARQIDAVKKSKDDYDWVNGDEIPEF